jgi:hypothetical protein
MELFFDWRPGKSLGYARMDCSCGRRRVFELGSLFPPGSDEPHVTLRKPCPACGSDTPLTVAKPPEWVPPDASVR